jgi:O-antigen biosynthesis protein WbqV
LLATEIGNAGEGLVLDMGAPVRIVDLARNLIVLSGLLPERDIRIEFSGVRPGEKMFEELKRETEHLVATSQPMISNVISPELVDEEGMRRFLWEMRQVVAAQDVVRLISLMKEMVPDYTPSARLLLGAGFSTDTGAEQVRGWERDEASLGAPATIATA